MNNFELTNGTIFVLAEAAGGIYNSDQLRLLCQVADEDAAFLKVTEDQRIGLMIAPEKLLLLNAKLNKAGILLRHYKGNTSPSPRACLGDLCPLREQDALGDSINVGTILSKRHPGLRPYTTVGMNGCAKNCLSSATDDLHIVGESTGYKISIGGKNAEIPQLGQFFLENISKKDLPEVLSLVLEVFYENHLEGERFCDVFDRVGMTTFLDRCSEFHTAETQEHKQTVPTPNVETAMLETETQDIPSPLDETMDMELSDPTGGSLDIPMDDFEPEMDLEIPEMTSSISSSDIEMPIVQEPDSENILEDDEAFGELSTDDLALDELSIDELSIDDLSTDAMAVAMEDSSTELGETLKQSDAILEGTEEFSDFDDLVPEKQVASGEDTSDDFTTDSILDESEGIELEEGTVADLEKMTFRIRQEQALEDECHHVLEKIEKIESPQLLEMEDPFEESPVRRGSQVIADARAEAEFAGAIIDELEDANPSASIDDEMELVAAAAMAFLKPKTASRLPEHEVESTVPSETEPQPEPTPLKPIDRPVPSAQKFRIKMVGQEIRIALPGGAECSVPLAFVQEGCAFEMDVGEQTLVLERTGNVITLRYGTVNMCFPAPLSSAA